MSSPVEAAIRGVVTKGIMGIAKHNRSHRKAKEPNPYLTGIHAPLADEHTFEDLTITGTIPAGLNGLYVRNGPNPIDAPNPATHHWFVGDGMLHGLRIKDGQALWYRNRWVRSNKVSAAKGEAPAPGTRDPRTDTANTNIVGHAGKIWAIVEAGGHPVEVSDLLETRAHSNFEGTLGTGFSAHPHLDPNTGEMHAICYYAENATTVWHKVWDTRGKIRRKEPIAVQDGPSIHDCMITESYVVVMDLPVTFSMKSVMAGDAFPYKWNPKHKARIGLLPREGKGEDIIWCDVDPCYIFHPANAYETADGKVIMDACVHATMFADSTYGPDSKTLTFEQLTIDPATRQTTRTVIDGDAQEFPRPDERLIGMPYRYAYAVAMPSDGNENFASESRLYKHDRQTGTRAVHEFGDGKMPGEFVFVPAHENSAEDEGWLIGYVVDPATGTTDLEILDAQNFTGPALAKVTIPHMIPPGFHGNFIEV
jgi:carotenoid cleavage dioxygenase